MAPVRALNKMTKAGMPESVRIASENTTRYGETYLKSDLFNKAKSSIKSRTMSIEDEFIALISADGECRPLELFYAL